MKKRMKTLVIVAACAALLGAGCIFYAYPSIHYFIDVPEKVFSGTYTVVSASGTCTESCITCDSGPYDPGTIQSVRWYWEEVPGSDEPEIVNLYADDHELEEGLVAFHIGEQGAYKIVLEVTCTIAAEGEEEDGKNTSTETFTRLFTVEDDAEYLASDTILSEPEAETKQSYYDNIATQLEAMGVDPDRNTWMIRDIEDDGASEVFFFKQDDDAAPLETCDIVDGNPVNCAVFTGDFLGGQVTYAQSMLGTSFVGGAARLYVLAVVGGMTSVAIYDLDLVLLDVSLVDVWTYGGALEAVEQPAIDLDGDGVPDFVAQWSDTSTASPHLDATIFFDANGDGTMHNNSISIYSDTFVGVEDVDGDGDQDIIYKIGTRYFVYEAI